MARKKSFVGLGEIEADSLVSCPECGTVWNRELGDECPVCSLEPKKPENPGMTADGFVRNEHYGPWPGDEG